MNIDKPDLGKILLGISDEDIIKKVEDLTGMKFTSASDAIEYMDRCLSTSTEPKQINGAIRDPINMAIGKSYVIHYEEQEPWEVGKLLKLDLKNATAVFENGSLLDGLVEDETEVYLPLRLFGVTPFFGNNWVTDVYITEKKK